MMQTQRILEDLPEVYRLFLPAFFHEHVPLEVNASCNKCAMCKHPDQPEIPGVEYFKPDAKCCTFHPKLPNYLVGGLFVDTNPALDEGRRRMREKINSRLGITPQSVAPPKKFAVLLKYGGNHSFGKSNAMICPFYISDPGLCSIWKYREAVCSTYFCKTVGGKDGVKFWNMVRSYLMHAQDMLIWYALNEMNWDTESLSEYLRSKDNDNLTPEDLDDRPPSDAEYNSLWGAWAGREEEFYKQCFLIVQKLTPDEFDRIGGMVQRNYYEWVKKRHKAMVSPEIPSVLIKNPDMKSFPLNGLVAVKTELGFFTIQPALREVIDLFDGTRTIAEVQKIVSEQYGDDLGDQQLIPMFQNRMLIPAS